MKWMLFVLVFGSHPVETNLLFDNIDACLKAEETMRTAYRPMRTSLKRAVVLTSFFLPQCQWSLLSDDSRADGEAPPAQCGTSPVPQGEPVTAGGAVTDKIGSCRAFIIKRGVDFGRRPLF